MCINYEEFNTAFSNQSRVLRTHPSLSKKILPLLGSPTPHTRKNSNNSTYPGSPQQHAHTYHTNTPHTYHTSYTYIIYTHHTYHTSQTSHIIHTHTHIIHTHCTSYIHIMFTSYIHIMYIFVHFTHHISHTSQTLHTHHTSHTHVTIHLWFCLSLGPWAPWWMCSIHNGLYSAVRSKDVKVETEKVRRAVLFPREF